MRNLLIALMGRWWPGNGLSVYNLGITCSENPPDHCQNRLGKAAYQYRERGGDDVVPFTIRESIFSRGTSGEVCPG